MEKDHVHYARSRFSTRLPADRLYTASHAWLREQEPGVWRVGFTKFATRLLGEPVEYDLEVEPDAPVQCGEIVGWIEGFKAVTDLFCPLDGRLVGANAALDDDLTIVQRDPYRAGWLYAVEGEPTDDCLDVEGYARALDGTIDRMTGKTI